MELQELLAFQASDRGKPYKGNLIDMAAWERNPGDLSCMCAQGQALHALAGWTPERLSNTEQVEADLATAEVLNISRAHAILYRQVNDKQDGAPAAVLTHPERFIGDQARTVLAFWLALDGFTAKQWDAAGAASWAAAWAAAWDAARTAAGDASWAAAWPAAWDASWAAAWPAAWDAAAGGAAGDAAWAAAGAAARASNEIQGANLLAERGQAFYFLPLFGFANPEAIPPLPADYARAQMEVM